MSRWRDLVDAAAGVLEDGGHPFCTEFLVAHDVSYDEAMSLSRACAAGLRLGLILSDPQPPEET